MNKRPKEIDIFQRTLKCRDLPLEAQEIEIFEVESEEKLAEEEELPVEFGSEVDPEALHAELECLKRQLQRLLLLVKAKIEAQAEPRPQPPPTCEEEAATCALQKAHHKLQCQIRELLRCYALIREEIRRLHGDLCVENKEVAQLWRLVAFFKYWQVALKGDEGVCLQRFDYLQQQKAEWREVQARVCQKSRCPQLLMQRYLGQAEFHSQRVYLQAELQKLKNIFVFLFELKNPSYGDDFDSTPKAQPIKQIEIDYIRRQAKLNRALYDKDCKEYFKCDRIEWK